MDALTTGADIGTMLTGLSAVTAAYVWTMGRFRDWRRQKVAIAERNWGGYISPGGINGWDVRLAEEPNTPTSRVVLEVLGNNAQNWADNLRQTVLRDGKLSRSDRRGVGLPQVPVPRARLRQGPAHRLSRCLAEAWSSPILSGVL